MKLKTFISHKDSDSDTASTIGSYLRIRHGIEVYADVFDLSIKDGPRLANYLKEKLHDCTNLLVVVSEETKGSWWVPWEIGVASERDYPLATYARQAVTLPSYLKMWPYLRNEPELDRYAEALKNSVQLLVESRFASASAETRRTATQDFYRLLTRKLSRPLGT